MAKTSFCWEIINLFCGNRGKISTMPGRVRHNLYNSHSKRRISAIEKSKTLSVPSYIHDKFHYITLKRDGSNCTRVYFIIQSRNLIVKKSSCFRVPVWVLSLERLVQPVMSFRPVEFNRLVFEIWYIMDRRREQRSNGWFVVLFGLIPQLLIPSVRVTDCEGLGV